MSDVWNLQNMLWLQNMNLQTTCLYIGRYFYKILIQKCNLMVSNLCAIYFVDDDLHLVKVREKGLETLLQYSKLHCDEKLGKVLSESSPVFVSATWRQDYKND